MYIRQALPIMVLFLLSAPSVASPQQEVPAAVEVTGGDGIVVFAGEYSARFTPPGVVRTGIFSNTWQRQTDGAWKIRASVTQIPVIETGDEVRDVVGSLVTMWSRHDLSGLDSLFAPDARYRDMAVGFDGRGVDSIRRFFESTLAAVPDFRVEVSRMLVEGEWVATEWTMSGTQTGVLGDLPASGNSFSVPGLSITLVRHGRIVAHRDYYDEQELLGQLAGEGTTGSH